MYQYSILVLQENPHFQIFISGQASTGNVICFGCKTNGLQTVSCLLWEFLPNPPSSKQSMPLQGCAGYHIFMPNFLAVWHIDQRTSTLTFLRPASLLHADYSPTQICTSLNAPSLHRVFDGRRDISMYFAPSIGLGFLLASVGRT